MPITGGVHDISWMGLVELGVSGRRRSRLCALDSGPFEVEENDDKRKTIDREDLSGHRPCRQGICSWRGHIGWQHNCHEKGNVEHRQQVDHDASSGCLHIQPFVFITVGHSGHLGGPRLRCNGLLTGICHVCVEMSKQRFQALILVAHEIQGMCAIYTERKSHILKHQRDDGFLSFRCVR